MKLTGDGDSTVCGRDVGQGDENYNYSLLIYIEDISEPELSHFCCSKESVDRRLLCCWLTDSHCGRRKHYRCVMEHLHLCHIWIERVSNLVQSCFHLSRPSRMKWVRIREEPLQEQLHPNTVNNLTGKHLQVHESSICWGRPCDRITTKGHHGNLSITLSGVGISEQSGFITRVTSGQSALARTWRQLLVGGSRRTH